MFFRSFALDSKKMASRGEDNAEEKNTRDAAHVTTNEGESSHRSDSRLSPKLRLDGTTFSF